MTNAERLAEKNAPRIAALTPEEIDEVLAKLCGNERFERAANRVPAFDIVIDGVPGLYWTSSQAREVFTSLAGTLVMDRALTEVENARVAARRPKT